MVEIIVFSSVSENTLRFTEKLRAVVPELTVTRLPLRRNDPEVHASAPFVLFVPTYGGGGAGGEVPKQVIRFLNHPENRDLLRGVVSFGNTNFGASYCAAGDIIAAKCQVPHLARVELFGTPEDVTRIASILEEMR